MLEILQIFGAKTSNMETEAKTHTAMANTTGKDLAKEVKYALGPIYRSGIRPARI